MQFRYAIVGLGPAGMFLLSLFPKEWLSDTLVLDPTCVGGDLATQYSGTIANIPKATVVSAFQKIPRWSNCSFSHFQAYSDTECPKLADICRQMRDCVQPDLRQTTVHTVCMRTLVQTKGGWKLQTDAGTWEAERVILCTGARPKVLDLPKPTLPLSNALCRTRLQASVSPTTKVVVFGLSHSGTLVLRNLYTIGCTRVTGVYRGDTPFVFARDGNPTGIKQESAAIADEILTNAWGDATPTLLNSEDFCAVYRAVSSAEMVVYSIGFESVYPHCVKEDGTEYCVRHNARTGECEGVPNLWGFGIGFPTQDVGFHAFIDAIRSSTLLPNE